MGACLIKALINASFSMSHNAPTQHSHRFLPPLNALKAFESAARLQSLTKASEELNVTRAAVSQQVKQLEHYLEATLFERSGSKLTLTDDAQYYLPLLTQMFDSLSVGTEQLFERERRNLLTLNVAQSFCHQWLIPRVSEFKRLNPNLELKIATTSNPYPNTSQTADIEIINGMLPKESQLTERLTDEHWVLVASQSYLKQHGVMELTDIAEAEKITTSGYRENWTYWFNQVGYCDDWVKPKLHFDHSLLAVEAAVCGLGILLVKDVLVEEQLKQGELIKVGEWKVPCETSHYILCHNPSNSMAIEFFDWLRHSFN